MQRAPTASSRAKSDAVRRVLDRGGLIDITTTGRRSKRPRRLEIVFHNIDGRIVISGSPRRSHKRAWILNLEADPRITIHIKGPLEGDLPGTARVITDPVERQSVADWIVGHAWPQMDRAAMVAASPMIEVTLDDEAA